MRAISKFMILAVSVGSLLFASKTNAQIDPHFSQYYMYPSWLNPALTGVFDGDYRVTGIYRSQWGNITTPFSTPGVSVDFNGANTLNFGGSVMQQTAGDGGYSYLTAYGNIAYTGVKFGTMGYQRLVFGLQAGLIQRKFNPNKMQWGSQYNPLIGYDPNLPPDILSRTSASAFDAGAGVLYYDAEPGKKMNLYAGFSASHITMPEDKFSANSSEKIPVRYTLHGGLRIAVNENFSVTPNILYLRQRTASEFMIGAYGQIKAPLGTEFLFGANYRLKDAISPYIGIFYKNVTLGISYDVNSSDLSKIQRGSNSFEISLSFIGKKKTKTPKVEFICPRL
ncbi:MAG: PorP/SprF family type IX secretion system membrane protein [Chitinophagales bacterium]|nr:PorP/SprF family type IX secretion system membrane protein [Chitinophagales bacterium]